ncbi:MAG: hypothetical protein AAGD38_12550 [Acidobacteriota bacterium]
MLRSIFVTTIFLVFNAFFASPTIADTTHAPEFADHPSLELRALDARYVAELDSLVFTIEAAGDAASITPEPAGQVHGAPVLGYVFTTDLSPSDVGFRRDAGTVALAITSHPDFDDTPLWDEDQNEAYDDDGAVYHAHWVVLDADQRAPAGLAVVQADKNDVLPPTAPMPMYLDSPGFTVVERGNRLHTIVPADRVKRRVDLEIGALTAFMRVDASGDRPLLAVHHVLSKLDTTRKVTGTQAAAKSAWPRATTDENPAALDVTAATATYFESLDTYHVSLDVRGRVATVMPIAAGQVDGAPVLGYVFPTTMPPASVGFREIEGTLVLAVTSHPDFDDTPLWDENLDSDYGNDGATYHVHWAVLVDDEASPAGLSVPSQADKSLLPPTAPMPMYLDSPGYHAFANGSRLSVLVPGWHLRGIDTFRFDALTAHMRVDASGPNPVLRVEKVIDLLSGDLSLPFTPQTVDDVP